MSESQVSQQDSSAKVRIQLKLSDEDRESEILSYFSPKPPQSPHRDEDDDEEEEVDFNNNNARDACLDTEKNRSPDGDSLGPETSRESEQTQTTDRSADNFDDQTTIELRLLVRRREAGALIGKRGANIKRLREQFRSSIFSIPDTGNGPERVVCVATGEKSMGPILDDLTQVLVEKSAENDDQLELKLLIHSSQAGSIIGLGGQSIKKLRNDSKAAIKIYELCCPFSSERVCAIKAKPPVVVRTIKLIQAILNQNPIKGTVKPYDALHFDPMLADKYGGYLPDDGYADMIMPQHAANVGSNQFHNHHLSNSYHHHHHHHNQQYPSHQPHRHHFEPHHHHPPLPVSFGRAQMQPESMGYPVHNGNNHYSVWRSSDLMREHSPQSCNDISCFAAAAAVAAAAAANVGPPPPRATGAASKTPMDNHDALARKRSDQCDRLVSMNQLMGAYAAAADAAARTRSIGATGGRFHPYGHHVSRFSNAPIGSNCQQHNLQFAEAMGNHCHRGGAAPVRPQYIAGPVCRASVNIARAFALQAEEYRQRQAADSSNQVAPEAPVATQETKATQPEAAPSTERPA